QASNVYGEICGSVTYSSSRVAPTSAAFSPTSHHSVALRSDQKSRSSAAGERPPASCVRSAYQASSPHIAPPDVPLSARTWTRWSSSAGPASHHRRRRPRAPAVNAVRLPPPWQAIAILASPAVPDHDSSPRAVGSTATPP